MQSDTLAYVLSFTKKNTIRFIDIFLESEMEYNVGDAQEKALELERRLADVHVYFFKI